MDIVCDIQKEVLDKIKANDFEIQFEEKGDSNYVTKYDTQIEEILKQKLLELIPESSFIGEESGVQEGTESVYTWIVDPIDGTTNFIRHLPFTISIALVRSSTTELGLVYDATAKEIYTAIRGRGAFLNGKPIYASQNEQVKDSIFMYGYPYDATKTKRIVEKTLKVKEHGAADIKRIGPSSLDICRIARGQIDGYFEYDLQPWDVSASILILQEARGKIIKMNGMPYDYKKTGIIATNQSENLQKELFKLVGDPTVIDMER